MYMTEQRKKIFEFLRARRDMNMTAKDLAAALKGEGVSLSAVYRNLDKLEKEGLILRIPGKTNRENLYRYISAEECGDKIHMTCLSCGKTIHMDPVISESLRKQVLLRDGFAIDAAKSTLYGLCENCR